MSDRYLIVGLGNPGRDYEHTRHNVGFWVIDELARRHGMTEGARKERKSIVLDGLIHGKRVILVKPQTYMNLSGQAVRALLDFYKLDIANLIVIHDDLDTPFSQIRLKKGGGHGGQNGMRNIIQHLGTQEFARVRFGIGRPPGKMQAVNYVLMPFTGDDAILARELTDKAANAVEIWLKEGIEMAMTKFNGENGKNDKPQTDPAEELAIALRAHEMAPNDPKPLEKIVLILKRIGKLDEAVQRHLQLAEIYDRMEKPESAVINLERAASIQPERIELHHAIANAYLRQNNNRKAVARYLTLAEYLDKQGNPDGALEAVHYALKINDQHPKALDMLTELEKRVME